jgi:uncharacterized protein YxjI
MKHFIDVDLIRKQLLENGHEVGNAIPVPDNAGEYEFEVDGSLLSLAETRSLLEEDAGETVAEDAGETALH